MKVMASKTLSCSAKIFESLKMLTSKKPPLGVQAFKMKCGHRRTPQPIWAPSQKPEIQTLSSGPYRSHSSKERKVMTEK